MKRFGGAYAFEENINSSGAEPGQAPAIEEGNTNKEGPPFLDVRDSLTFNGKTLKAGMGLKDVRWFENNPNGPRTSKGPMDGEIVKVYAWVILPHGRHAGRTLWKGLTLRTPTGVEEEVVLSPDTTLVFA